MGPRRYFAAAAVAIGTAGALAGPAQAGHAWLRFAESDRWTSREILKTPAIDPATKRIGVKETESSKDMAVLKVFKDGTALLQIASSSAPDGKSYLLVTPDGKIYRPQSSQDSSEKKTIMMEMGTRDDLTVLLETAGPEEWLDRAPEPVPIDDYKLPPKPIRTGRKVERMIFGEVWTIERLPDEKVRGTPCRKFRAVAVRGGTETTETLWLDADKGAVLQRTIEQSGPSPYAVLQTREDP
ncbi:MAG: hypothetical protein A2902_04785 [Elusimicrobia bacterium RIFCSPLOWO2_01_FULL_64_13]|nr:MAG: hypothetical protein A2636_06605 [Elusimicrobia bacterium RIFCSPHIGHO2_01_FULL_64_10]OGR95245.1 MAG: hypothetical protein A2902_04785 [Elusimicrobia bacterium RIFCSPLOWO2_01_FULL_64_13]